MSNSNESLVGDPTFDHGAALAFLVEIGADEAIENAPVDRFAVTADARLARQAQLRPASPTSTSSASTSYVSASYVSASGAAHPAQKADTSAETSAGRMHAFAAAKEAQSLDALYKAIVDFEGCALKATASSTVFADGSPEAKVMFIGDGPGAEEDKLGRPFVGEVGHLLDNMMGSIGLDRSSAYITNIVPWRPPGNRAPNQVEVEMMMPFVQRHIDLVGPDIVVPLGGVAAKALVQTIEGITRLRGKWADVPTANRSFKALPTYHPAYLLRTPAAKRQAWQDLLSLAAAL